MSGKYSSGNFRGHFAKKYFGQHWLKDESILQKIISAAEIKDTDNILEIGPGRGSLTKKLLQSPANLIKAIEVDAQLINFLQDRFVDYSKFNLTRGDILSTSFNLPNGDFPNKVVANIPYNLTGPILERLLGKLGEIPTHTFQHLVLLVQKEVADRITSTPDKSSYSALSIRIQLVAECSEVCHVPPSCFEPQPKVHSKVISLKPFLPQQRLSNKIENKIDNLLTAAFMSRRKKIRNTLTTLCSLEILEQVTKQIGITLDQRPQELSPMNWVNLANSIQLTDHLSSNEK